MYHGLLVFEKKGKMRLLWRAIGFSSLDIFSVENRNGKTFEKASSLVTFFRPNGTKLALGKEPFLRVSNFGAKTVLFFVDNKKEGAWATERAGSWQVMATSNLFHGPTVCVKLPARKGKNGRTIFFSARSSRVLFQTHASLDFKRFKDDGDILAVRRNSFDATAIAPLFAELTAQGILLVYSAKNALGRLVIGAALFDHDNPQILLWRSDEALWELSARASLETVVLGGTNIGKHFFIFVQAPGKIVERFPMARLWETVKRNKHEEYVLPTRKKGLPIKLDRAVSNPVLEPISKNSWEAFATFNPAALYLQDRVHLLYRAQGYDGLSVLGYAASTDGIEIDERQDRPAFVPSQASETRKRGTVGSLYPYISGGGTGGCEDPRLVEIDGSIYLIYVAFDGTHPPGVALSYISKKNFLTKAWRWSPPKLISRPGEIQKNWVIFPEKINGNYAVLHGLSPNIRIEYVENLKRLGSGKYIESLSSHGGRGYVEATRLHAWDNIVRGVGAPPLRTKYGWLVFYHGMDMRDPGRYKAGVMLLDLKHPEIVLKRSIEPVLEPETEYENGGHKRGVVYVCGAVIKGRQLLVYYGAGDRTTAVAMADLETFLQSLLKEKSPVLQKMNLKKIC